jgi:hypothetical protein
MTMSDKRTWIPGRLGALAILNFAAALAPTSIGAQDYSTGNAYYTQCKDETSTEGLKCLAYLTGLLARHGKATQGIA